MTIHIYVIGDEYDQNIASALERAGMSEVVVVCGSGGPLLGSSFPPVEQLTLPMSYYDWCFGTGYYNFWDYVGAWAAREFQTIQRNHSNAAKVRQKLKFKPRNRKPNNARTIKRAFKR